MDKAGKLLSTILEVRMRALVPQHLISPYWLDRNVSSNGLDGITAGKTTHPFNTASPSRPVQCNFHAELDQKSGRQNKFIVPPVQPFHRSR